MESGLIIESIFEKPWPTYIVVTVYIKYLCDSLRGVSEGEAVPRQVVCLHAL